MTICIVSIHKKYELTSAEMTILVDFNPWQSTIELEDEVLWIKFYTEVCTHMHRKQLYYKCISKSMVIYIKD